MSIPKPPPGFSLVDDSPDPPEGFSLVKDYESKQGVKVDPSTTEGQGIGSALKAGFQQTGRSLGAFADVLQGDEAELLAGVQTETPTTGPSTRFMQAFERETEGAEGIGGAIAGVGKAIYEEPLGALHKTAEMLPNSAVIVGGMAAGAKAGAVAGTAVAPGPGTAVGAVVGGVIGLLAGNTSIETGAIAQEQAREGAVDTDKALKQGLIKGGVITAVDTATIGLNKLLMGAPGKAASKAAEGIFEKAGLGAADDAARIAAMQADPALNRAVVEGATAAAVNSLPKKMQAAARATLGMGLESVGEGAGEYLGSKAAGLDASLAEAVLEAALSVPQSAVETGIGGYLGKKGREADLQKALEGTTPLWEPPDSPTTQGMQVEEIEDQVIPAPPAEPFPAAEGIGVEEIPQTPLQMLARRMRNRVGGMGGMEEITLEDVPRGTPEPSVAAQTTRLVTDTAFKKAELAKREKEQAEKEEGAKQAVAEAEKRRRTEQDLQGVKESIQSRRAQAKERLEGTKATGKALEKEQDAYIKEMDALDEEEQALKVIEKAQKKATVTDKVTAKEEKPLPLPEVKELPPGVLDEKRPKSGQPYKTQASAENIKRITPKYANYEVVEVEGGYVLQDRGKPPPAPTTEGIEVEELKKIPGPRPSVGKAPERVPGGSQLRDALKAVGLKSTDQQARDELQAQLEKEFPGIPRQAGDMIAEGDIPDLDIDALLRGEIPDALKPQAGEAMPLTEPGTNLDGRPFGEEVVGPQPEIPGFLQRDEDMPVPPKNGQPAAEPIIETGPTGGGQRPAAEPPTETEPPAEGSPYDKNPEDWTDEDISDLIDEATGAEPAEPTVETGPTGGAPAEPVVDKFKLEADRRKRKAQIRAQIMSEGLNMQTPEGKERDRQLREEQGLDEDYNFTQEPETTEPTVETGPTGPTGTTATTGGFTPPELEDDLVALGVEDDALEGITISYEFEGEDVGEGTVEAPARQLLALSRKRIDILTKLGGCVSK